MADPKNPYSDIVYTKFFQEQGGDYHPSCTPLETSLRSESSTDSNQETFNYPGQMVGLPGLPIPQEEEQRHMLILSDETQTTESSQLLYTVLFLIYHTLWYFRRLKGQFIEKLLFQ